MNRRHFLLAASALAATPHWAHANSAWQNQTGAGAIPKAWPANLTPLRGFAGQPVSCDRAAIEGDLPADLRGAFYRNGPGLFERASERYRHWFDGDGLVHAWRFTDKGVSHHARFVETPKFVAEQAAGTFLYPVFGTTLNATRPVRSADSVNPANINVIQHGGRLMALWEAGSAYAMDADTLATKGPVAWSRELKGMPFSAHPKVEPNGTLWNFGTMMGKAVLYQISAHGDLVKHAVFDAPSGSMVHDFAVSERHIIMLFSPLFMDAAALRNGRSFGQAMRWHGDKCTQVLVVEKDDFSRRQVYELPAFMVFHFGNAWEADGVIRLDFAQSPDASVMLDWIPAFTAGDAAASPNHRAVPTLLTINTRSGKLAMESRTEEIEFPRIDPRYVARRNRYVYYPVADPAANNVGWLNGVMRLDFESGRVDQHFMAGVRLEEHVFVPKPGDAREGQGYLVGVGFDVARQQSFATVFDAENIAAGPRCKAWLPYWLPHCFHGNFYSA